jgi:hypothetical protein
LDQDELIDRWTLVGDELNLVAGKRGATKLGFALLLRFYTKEAGSLGEGAKSRTPQSITWLVR